MASPRLLAVAIAATFPVAGVLDAAAPVELLPGLAIAHGLLVGALSYAWCRAESLRRHRAPPGRSALLAGVLPLVGVPLYFFRTRPWRQAGRDSAHAAVFVILLVLLQHASAAGTRSLLP